jgi:hypothetical protein
MTFLCQYDQISFKIAMQYGPFSSAVKSSNYEIGVRTFSKAVQTELENCVSWKESWERSPLTTGKSDTSTVQ